MKSIILMSGPVGAGKTTVARELLPRLPGPTAYIEGDRFWSFVVKGSAPRSPKHFKMVMTSMMAAAVPYALYGHDVVVDFSIPPWFLDTARAIAAVKQVPLHYIVLRPSARVCASRAAARSEGTIPDYGPFQEFYASFGEATLNLIQDDECDADAMSARIAQGLEAGAFRVS